VPRVKQFDDLIEEHPDFMTLRNHIAKTVAGDGKKVMLMGALWRLIRAACQLSQGIPTGFVGTDHPHPWRFQWPRRRGRARLKHARS
jgi:hypothetical protein